MTKVEQVKQDAASTANDNEEAVKLLVKAKKIDDRSCVIVLTAYLDTLLSQIIANKLVSSLEDSDELLSESSPFGSFGIKLKLSYRLGLISSDFYKAMRVLSKIRNKCAHEHNDVVFEDTQVKQLIENIVIAMKRKNHPGMEDKTTREKFEQIFIGAFILLKRQEKTLVPVASAVKEPMFE